jgi:hypothetical protein
LRKPDRIGRSGGSRRLHVLQAAARARCRSYERRRDRSRRPGHSQQSPGGRLNQLELSPPIAESRRSPCHADRYGRSLCPPSPACPPDCTGYMALSAAGRVAGRGTPSHGQFDRVEPQHTLGLLRGFLAHCKHWLPISGLGMKTSRWELQQIGSPCVSTCAIFDLAPGERLRLADQIADPVQLVARPHLGGVTEDEEGSQQIPHMKLRHLLKAPGL